MRFLPMLGALVASIPAQQGRTFEPVVETLSERYFDRAVRATLPDRAARFRPYALAATTLAEEREVIHEFLAGLGASHLALYSKTAHEGLMRGLTGRRAPTLGCELVEFGRRYYARSVLEEGPAARAGLRQGDRVLSVDGVEPACSPRLDWRTDDAALPDAPVHTLLVKNGDIVTLDIKRREGGPTITIPIEAAEYSALDAAKASARVIEQHGQRFGYVHFWFIHVTGCASLLRKLFRGPFRDCDGLILDLRGRGGSAAEVYAILEALKTWDRPCVALIDRFSRSAKEVTAYELRQRKLARLIGETTAGAVIPATFEPIGDHSVLMFPSFELGSYTDKLEGKGVDPDVAVMAAGPYSAGADPILTVGLLELGGTARPR